MQIVNANMNIWRNYIDIKEKQQKFDKNAIKVIYGGSVNSKNIMNLRKINNINGFLIGGASLNQNKFIDIIKKSIK